MAAAVANDFNFAYLNRMRDVESCNIAFTFYSLNALIDMIYFR